MKRLLLASLFTAALALSQIRINGARTIEASINFCADAGSNDTYACNIATAPSAYVTGAFYFFSANTANTGAATINFNSLGAKTIKKNGGTGATDLSDNDIKVGQLVMVQYDGTNMQMQSTLGNAAAGGGGSGTTYKEFIAGTCQLGVAGLTFSLPTSNAPSAVCVTGTNSNYAVASFPDSDGLYSVQSRIWLPSSWTGNIDLAITWRTAGTTGNVAWQLQTACVADAETGDPSWNTAQVITDAAKGTTLQWNTVTQTSITLTGCSASEHLLFKFGRDRTDGSDTIGAVTVELISLQFKMTV